VPAGAGGSSLELQAPVLTKASPAEIRIPRPVLLSVVIGFL
jgi:hypothetical protein